MKTATCKTKKEMNTEMDLREIQWENGRWMKLVQDHVLWQARALARSSISATSELVSKVNIKLCTLSVRGQDSTYCHYGHHPSISSPCSLHMSCCFHTRYWTNNKLQSGLLNIIFTLIYCDLGVSLRTRVNVYRWTSSSINHKKRLQVFTHT